MVNFVDIAKQFLLLVSDKLDTYTTEDGFVEVEGPFKVSLFTPAHVQFAKYGRGPGKKPPLDPILAWVGKKGILFKDSTKEGTAFAIQASIAKNGTVNYVPNAPNAIEEAINESFEQYSKALAKAFRVDVQKQVNEIYDETFPDKIKYKI